MWLSDGEFEDAVGEALGTIPAEFLDRLENVAIEVKPEPTAQQRQEVQAGELLGLYVGVSLPNRSDGYGWGALPDHIYLFSGPIQRVCSSRAEVLRQIRVTLVHEIGHYFGIDDARLHELGWG